MAERSDLVVAPTDILPPGPHVHDGLWMTLWKCVPHDKTDELIDSAEGVATQLDGFRGSAVLDRQALRELMLRFSLLLREPPEVVETDLNPVRCMTHGCVVLDMRLRIEPPRPVERVKTW